MASGYEFIMVEGAGTITITLNRPDVHNPFDDKMITELTDAFSKAKADQSARAVIITGAGKSFCAGADLNWMKRMGQYSLSENVYDATQLSRMFQALEDIDIPVIAKVNGAALGGGAGLACACDFAVASSKAKIGFTEVKLGLIPAVISPYVIDRVGAKRAGQLFMTGAKLEAEMARRLGLFDDVAEPQDLDAVVAGLVAEISTGGPLAVRECKRLARAGASTDRVKFKEHCIQAIARVRASPEGKEGVGAFLEKREPKWRSK